MVLKLEAPTAQFISAWVVPLVREMALSQAQVPNTKAPLSQNPQIQLERFRLCASQTPNIRNKVVWNPLQHTWIITVKKATGPLTGSYCVDQKLKPEEYEKKKVDTYKSAMEAWNSVDGSTRFRIAVA
jgi:hypothetical protein